MNSLHRYAITACCVGCLFAAVPWAQEATTPRPTGVPQDWSDHSIVFTLDGLMQHPELVSQEPRILHQLARRFSARGSNVSHGEGTDPAQLGSSKAPHRDWNYSLGNSHIAPEMFPAKYGFDPSAQPSCQNDFVVFGLNTAGVTGGQANLVGLNDLYSAPGGGPCGTSPSVMFAYNTTTATGGKISTSPVISLDGTKIAFVENAGTSSVFHVLTFTPGQGGISNAFAPTAMASVTYSDVKGTSTSSPWIDYGADIAYVADDGGTLHKFTGVFKGTPTEDRTLPWPVLVAAGTRLTAPVLDKGRGSILIGGRNGDLYEVNIANGGVSALIVGAHGGLDAGLFAPPIVDVSQGTAFVVSANDGNTAVLVQVDTTTFTQLAKAQLGIGAAGPLKNDVTLFLPALDNAYYTDPNSGTIYSCGTGADDSTPWQYSFGFTGRTMLTTPLSSSQLLTSTTARCTSWTEFFNPNVGANGTDFFFFGLTQDCSGTTGCVAARTDSSATLKTALVKGGPSGIVVDNFSTAPQASNIYLSGESTNTAYKFSQNGLN